MTATDRAALMAAVNAEIRSLARRVGDSPDARWPFVCECGDAGCDESVLVALDAYDELKEHGDVVLAPQHELERARAGTGRPPAPALAPPLPG